ncbi:hypothetical protein IAQ67_15335 [Paenibacillus peoriae]|uniref:Uncharacterized protein n=1 Tax=Paenibacillus peoriae TaxID=59893 RepID=A0A7H0Y2H1_9BACL|nr:hypothetical protein [Paenibacillus peoriae]QNR65279.1 hypothetical protein IAQ67_15335 [Paenibacillus peoriae]
MNGPKKPMRTIDEHIRMLWESDHLPWCQELGDRPGSFQEYSELIRPQITEEDLATVEAECENYAWSLSVNSN